LKGLLYCVPCGCRMSPTHAAKNGGTRYRYYRCRGAGGGCPSRYIPAAEVERVVVEQLRGLPDGAGAAERNGDLVQVRRVFDGMWGRLAPAEQARALRHLVERVDYDGGSGQLAVRVRPDGIAALARDWAEREETT
jgi:site-specific DNA recombinase